MASARRSAELRSSLLREFTAAAQSTPLDRFGRLRWLRHELENYLDRWLAFAAVDEISMRSLLKDDLLTMVLIASDVFEEQMTAAGCRVEGWDRFRVKLSTVQKAKDRTTIAGLRDALSAVAASLERTGSDQSSQST